MPASAQHRQAMEASRKTVAPRDAQRTKTGRAAVRAQDGATSRPIPSANALFPVLRAYLLFPFHSCLQIALCVARTAVRLPIQRSMTSEGRGGVPPGCECGDWAEALHKPERKGLACGGLPQGSPCGSAPSAALPSLRDLAGNCALDFIPAQRQPGFSHLRGNLCKV